jgi:hypothetical protein
LRFQQYRDAQTEGEVADPQIGAERPKFLSHPEPVNGTDEQNLALAKINDSFPLKPMNCFPFHRVFQTRTVNDGSLLDQLGEFQRFPQSIFSLAAPNPNVHSAKAQSINFAVQLLEQIGELAQIPIGSDSLNQKPLTEELRLNFLVPLR